MESNVHPPFDDQTIQETSPSSSTFSQAKLNDFTEFTAMTFKDSISENMGVEEYLPGKWRLFVHSMRSLKCIPIYNINEYSSVPIGHSIHAWKEKHEEINMVFNLLNTRNITGYSA